jgi:hypothetical protein
MWLRVLSVGGSVLIVLCLAQSTDKPDISGKWTLDPAKSKVNESSARLIQIEKKDKEMHWVETVKRNDKEATVEYQCAATGRECDMKDEGHPAKVSLYYNGPALMETKTNGREGEDVTRRKIELNADGTLQIEVVHIVPQKEKELLVYTRTAGTDTSRARKPQ